MLLDMILAPFPSAWPDSPLVQKAGSKLKQPQLSIYRADIHRGGWMVACVLVMECRNHPIQILPQSKCHTISL